MARVQIPVSTCTIAGVAQPAVTNGDATNDHYLDSTLLPIFLEAKNTDAGTQTLTIVTALQVTVDGVAIDLADVDISFLTGVTKMIKISGGTTFTQPSDSSRIYVDIAVANWQFRAYA